MTNTNRNIAIIVGGTAEKPKFTVRNETHRLFTTTDEQFAYTIADSLKRTPLDQNKLNQYSHFAHNSHSGQ